MAKHCVELNSQPVGLERVGKNIVVGCMDQTLQCFTIKVCTCIEQGLSQTHCFKLGLSQVFDFTKLFLTKD